MTDRQITQYLSIIPLDDENRELFIKVVVPVLRKAAKEPESTILCPFCVSDRTALLEPSYAVAAKIPGTHMVTFTHYSALVRHLSTQHRNLLPCNGYVLSQVEPARFRCEPCNQSFARKDHFNSHLRSQKHLRNSQGQRRQKEQREERHKKQMILRDCHVVVAPLQRLHSSTPGAVPQEKELDKPPTVAAASNDDEKITMEEALEFFQNDFSDTSDDSDEEEIDFLRTMDYGDEHTRDISTQNNSPIVNTWRNEQDDDSIIKCHTQQRPRSPSKSSDKTAASDELSDHVEEDDSFYDQLLIDALTRFELECTTSTTRLKRKSDEQVTESESDVSLSQEYSPKKRQRTK